MDVQTLNDIVARALTGRGLDGRRCYTSVEPMPPDGRRVLVDCSDAAVLDAVRQRAANPSWTP